jgi:hypothetical protein
MLSSIKYSQEELYNGFITNNLLRLFGSFVVFLSVFFATYLWNRVNLKRSKITAIKLENVKINRIFVYILILVYASIIVWRYIENPVSGYVLPRYIPTSKDLVYDLFTSTIINLLILSAGIYFIKGKIKTYIPLILVLLIFFFSSAVSGSRSALVGPLFLAIYILLYQGKISLRKVLSFTIFVPFVYLGFSTLIFFISGRVSNITKTRLAWDMAYRFDFSDFPLTILIRNKLFFIDIGQIIDGMKFSIPSFLWPDKLVDMSITTQEKLLMDSGLSPLIDYTDSFFSMGAELAGIVGLFAMYPVLVVVFEKIDIYFSKKKVLGFICLVVIFETITRIEIPWINFIPSIRDRIISIFIALIFYKLFFKFKKRHMLKE